ncbi:MAG TPA: zinc metalloprotease [Kofleriaceae bacterium]|jgi:hypothetical protein
MWRLPLLILIAVVGCAPDQPAAYTVDHTDLACGTREPSATAKMAIEDQTVQMPHAHDKVAPGAVIDIYVHVMSSGAGRDNGEVPLTDIDEQFDVLQAAYAPMGYTFRVAGIDRTTNPNWFLMTPGSPAEKAAKAALHRGGASALNIYTADAGTNIAGYATYPVDYTSAPYLDGVVILHSTLPNGSSAPFNEGDQLVHQVGHWLGLYHTYQATCADLDGDLVSDTPATNAPAYGCPMGRNSCGGGGDDPVQNYMDAADDQCMDSFTDGQRSRIDAQFTAYRRF